MSGYALVSIIHSEESVIFLKLYLCLALLSVLYTMCISSNMSQLVGLGGLEPPTSRLSGVRSNHLSYAPKLNNLVINEQLFKAGDENRTRDNSLEGCSFTTKLHPHHHYDNVWRETESNRRHMELQSIALPTELPSQLLREQDLNLRPSGYEPDELPSCSIPRQYYSSLRRMWDSNPRTLLHA